MAGDSFGSMEISASGLSAQRKRLEAIAKNIANAETTRGADGEVYRRRQVVLTAGEEGGGESQRAEACRLELTRTSPMHLAAKDAPATYGPPVPSVTAEEIEDPEAGYQLVHDPKHPDADENGYVRLPDISAVTEMVDLVAATRAYEANLAAMKAYQSMFNKSLEI